MSNGPLEYLGITDNPTYFYLIDKNPIVAIDSFSWSAWFRNIDNRKLKETKFANEYVISTVFLGIDHSCGIESGEGPKLFETMLFGYPVSNEVVYRTSTYEEAMRKHHNTCRLAIDPNDLVLEGD